MVKRPAFKDLQQKKQTVLLSHLPISLFLNDHKTLIDLKVTSGYKNIFSPVWPFCCLVFFLCFLYISQPIPTAMSTTNNDRPLYTVMLNIPPLPK